jgi:U3 small nucleolar RNA-associated protein 23
MRVQRQKGFRRTLNFYKLLFGLTSPYRLLLDGNFVATAVRLKMEWARLLPKALQVDASLAHFHVTQCVMAELASLGAPAEEALRAARTLPLLKCHTKHGHEEGCSPAECARRLVGGDNAGKWVVVTQDAALRDALRVIPGVPLMLISTNVLILEPPSAASRAAGEAAEGRKSALAPSEAQAVRRALKGSSAAAGAAAPAGAGSLAVAGKKRRRGPKEANPLSQKKKKQQQGAALAGMLGLGEGSSTAGGGKNRRKH